VIASLSVDLSEAVEYPDMSDVSSIVDIDYSPMDLEEMFGSYVGDGDDNPRSLLEVLPNEVSFVIRMSL